MLNSDKPSKRDGEGTLLEIEHDGYSHLTLDFRHLSKNKQGNTSNKRMLSWSLDAKAAVQLASVLLYIAEEHMRDSEESPHIHIVTAKEKAGFGANWVNEEYATAIERMERRKSRSYLFGLIKRCLEVCENEQFIKDLALNMGLWASSSEDEFSMQQAEKAIFQLGLVPKACIN